MRQMLLAGSLFLAVGLVVAGCQAENRTSWSSSAPAVVAKAVPPEPLVCGDEAFMRGDYETALWECLPLAEAGNPEAQFYLGQMYRRGYGVPQDHAEAVIWYRKAAEQSLPLAEAGNTDAQSLLGVLYGSGLGVPQNDVESIRWHRMAAEQGDLQAQIMLALKYWSANGGSRDLVKAYALVEISSIRIAELDQSSLTDRLRKGMRQAAKDTWELRKFIGQEMTAAEISRARQLVQDCAKKDYRSCGL